MTPLRRARVAAGFQLEEAANRAGIRPSYLALLERQGAGALTYPRARRLAELYSISMTQLIAVNGGRSEQQAGRN